MRLCFVGRQPHRTAPHTVRPERHCRCHLAPPTDATGTEHGDVDGVDDLGDQHHRADLAGVAAGLGTLGDDQVHPCCLMAFGVLRAPCERADQSALLFDSIDEELWWRPECVGDERSLVGE